MRTNILCGNNLCMNKAGHVAEKMDDEYLFICDNCLQAIIANNTVTIYAKIPEDIGNNETAKDALNRSVEWVYIIVFRFTSFKKGRAFEIKIPVIAEDFDTAAEYVKTEFSDKGIPRWDKVSNFLMEDREAHLTILILDDVIAEGPLSSFPVQGFSKLYLIDGVWNSEGESVDGQDGPGEPE